MCSCDRACAWRRELVQVVCEKGCVLLTVSHKSEKMFFAVLIIRVWSQWSFEGCSNTNEEAKTSFNHVK